MDQLTLCIRIALVLNDETEVNTPRGGDGFEGSPNSFSPTPWVPKDHLNFSIQVVVHVIFIDELGVNTLRDRDGFEGFPVGTGGLYGV